MKLSDVKYYNNFVIEILLGLDGLNDVDLSPGSDTEEKVSNLLRDTEVDFDTNRNLVTFRNTKQTKEIANVLGEDEKILVGAMNDTASQLRHVFDESLNKLPTLEELHEAKMAKVKRSHGEEHPAINADMNAKMRNQIVEFIGSHNRGRVTREELLEYFNQMNEDDTPINAPSRSWVHKNKHLIEAKTVKGEKCYELTRAGRNLYEKIKSVNESKVNELYQPKINQEAHTINLVNDHDVNEVEKKLTDAGIKYWKRQGKYSFKFEQTAAFNQAIELLDIKVNESTDEYKVSEFLIELEKAGYDVAPGSDKKKITLNKPAKSDDVLSLASVMGINASYDEKTGVIEISGINEQMSEKKPSYPDVQDIVADTIGENELVSTVIYKTLVAMSKGDDENKAFTDAADDENLHGNREDIVADRELIKQVLADEYGINVEYLNESANEDKSQGGLSGSVWNQKPIQGYTDKFGWLYNSNRTDELDKKLEQVLNDAKFSAGEIAAFMVSTYGRHLDKDFTGIDKAISDLRAHFSERGTEMFEAQKSDEDVVAKYKELKEKDQKMSFRGLAAEVALGLNMGTEEVIDILSKNKINEADELSDDNMIKTYKAAKEANPEGSKKTWIATAASEIGCGQTQIWDALNRNTVNESSWDSSWDTDIKIDIEGKKAPVYGVVMYDTDGWVSLQFIVTEDDLQKLGYDNADGSLTLWSHDIEDVDDVRSLDDSDAHDMVTGDRNAPKMDFETKKWTFRDIEQMMKDQDLDTTRQTQMFENEQTIINKIKGDDKLKKEFDRINGIRNKDDQLLEIELLNDQLKLSAEDLDFLKTNFVKINKSINESMYDTIILNKNGKKYDIIHNDVEHADILSVLKSAFIDTKNMKVVDDKDGTYIEDNKGEIIAYWDMSNSSLYILNESLNESIQVPDRNGRGKYKLGEVIRLVTMAATYPEYEQQAYDELRWYADNYKGEKSKGETQLWGKPIDDIIGEYDAALAEIVKGATNKINEKPVGNLEKIISFYKDKPSDFWGYPSESVTEAAELGTADYKMSKSEKINDYITSVLKVDIVSSTDGLIILGRKLNPVEQQSLSDRIGDCGLAATIEIVDDNTNVTINENEMNDGQNNITIKTKDYTWYVQKIDSTHIKMAMNPQDLQTGRAAVWHIEQQKDQPYYNDLKNWLAGEDTPAELVYEAAVDSPETFAKQMIINAVVNNNPDFKKDLAMKRLKQDLDDAKRNIESYKKRQSSTTDKAGFDSVISKYERWQKELEDEINSNGRWVEKLLNDVKNKDFSEIDKWDDKGNLTLGTFREETKINELQKVDSRDANNMYPGYNEYPNIHQNGSLTGMKKLYGWDTTYLYQIDGYIYNLKGHPNVSEAADGGDFNYRLLGRLQSDCEYFLGHGGGSERSLWADTVEEQIAKMKELWNGLPKDGKPEWLSMKEIEKYEKDMLAMKKKMNEVKQSLDEYKELVKKALYVEVLRKDEADEIWNDQDFYDDMVGAFQSGVSPDKFVKDYMGTSLNEAKEEQIDTEISNLWIKKFGRDTNGNKTISIGFPNDRGTSIQVSSLPKAQNLLYNITNLKEFGELSDTDRSAVIKDIIEYVKKFGSKDMQSRLKLYEAQKYDIEAAVKNIKDFNINGTDTGLLAIDILKNLGINAVQDNISAVVDHLGASAAGGAIPEDKTLIKEIIAMFENKINEGYTPAEIAKAIKDLLPKNPKEEDVVDAMADANYPIDNKSFDNIISELVALGIDFKVEEEYKEGDKIPSGNAERLSSYPKEIRSGIKFWKAYASFESMYSAWNSYSEDNPHHKNPNFFKELSPAVDSGNVKDILKVVNTEAAFGVETDDTKYIERVLKNMDIGAYESKVVISDPKEIKKKLDASEPEVQISGTEYMTKEDNIYNLHSGGFIVQKLEDFDEVYSRSTAGDYNVNEGFDNTEAIQINLDNGEKVDISPTEYMVKKGGDYELYVNNVKTKSGKTFKEVYDMSSRVNEDIADAYKKESDNPSDELLGKILKTLIQDKIIQSGKDLENQIINWMVGFTGDEKKAVDLAGKLISAWDDKKIQESMIGDEDKTNNVMQAMKDYHTHNMYEDHNSSIKREFPDLSDEFINKLDNEWHNGDQAGIIDRISTMVAKELGQIGDNDELIDKKGYQDTISKTIKIHKANEGINEETMTAEPIIDTVDKLKAMFKNMGSDALAMRENPSTIKIKGNPDDESWAERAKILLDVLGWKPKGDVQGGVLLAVNESDVDNLWSDYYEIYVTPDMVKNAYDFYVDYMEKENIDYEIMSVDEIDEDNIDEILYHAELQGMSISEGCDKDKANTIHETFKKINIPEIHEVGRRFNIAITRGKVKKFNYFEYLVDLTTKTVIAKYTENRENRVDNVMAHFMNTTIRKKIMK